MGARRGAVARYVVAVTVCVALLGGCTAGDPGGEPRAPRTAASPPGPAEILGLEAGWGPTEAELDRAARLTGGLTLRELAGQVIVADWAGTAAPVRLVRSLHLGGVIAFADNIASTDQVRRVTRRLHRSVRRPWPVLVSVDQEGGLVERVQGSATRFPAFMSAGAAGDTDLTRAAYEASGRELRGLGFTVDFAPVADVTIGPEDPAIGSRSAAGDPEVAARHVVAAAEGFLAAGVLPVVKHFPGHGSVMEDSHVTLPVQRRSLPELRRHDLVPFRAAVAAGLPAVMVGHLDVRTLDPGTPSSLSRRVITGLLRRELGFEGLVVTDSLRMAAVARRFPSADSAVQALRAGADVLLMPPDPRAARDGLVRAVRRDRLSRSRLRQAATRLVAVLLHVADSGRGRPPGSARGASRRLSAAALTVVTGPCRGRLVEDAVVVSGDPTAAAHLRTAADRAGLEVLSPRVPPRSLTTEARPPRHRAGEPARSQRRDLRRWRRAERRREAALADWRAAEAARLAAATSVVLVGPGDGPADGDVVVATDRPAVLGPSDGRVEIAAYGDTPGAMAALVDLLLGRAEASGRLPVPVSGVDRRGC